MTEEITATEASRRLGITDKTLRRWIAQGKIKARQVTQTRLALNVDDVASLAEQIDKAKAVDIDGMFSSVAGRLAEAEQRLLDLERHIAELESRVETLEARPAKQIAPPKRSQPVPSSEEMTTLWPDDSKQAPNQPPDTITLQELANQLGISRRALLEWVMNKHMEHISVPIPNREGQFNRYFSSEQAQAVKRARGIEE